jgi:hypothetical protein
MGELSGARAKFITEDSDVVSLWYSAEKNHLVSFFLFPL